MEMGLQEDSPSRQEAAKAAHVVMTAAAVMLASKRASKNKELISKSGLNAVSRKKFKHSFDNGKKVYVSIFQIL